MLKFISIENFALIDRLEVEFLPGLNVITGETGSGKSILVDAVGLLTGNRASQEMIRQGYERAKVEGVFDLSSHHPAHSILHDAGITIENNELIVRREITASGSNKVFVNNALTPLTALAELGALLVDIHGQHEQQHLLQPSMQLDFLDAFGDNSAQVSKVAECFHKLSRVRSEIHQLKATEQEKLGRMDALLFEIDDIRKLQLRPDLDIELENERRLLASAENRAQYSHQAYQMLYGEEHSSLSCLHGAEKTLDDLVTLDPDQESVVLKVRELRYLLEEIALYLRDYSTNIQPSSARLEEVEGRLSEIQKARHRYGDSVNEILAHLEKIQLEVKSITDQENHMASLQREEEAVRSAYLGLADRLSQSRHRSAEELGQRVQRELVALNMEGVIFRIEITTDANQLLEKGIDHVQFLFSANPGESPQPLAKIASGGELSRTILALKSILTLEDYSKIVVFDEVDSGIGGHVASSVGDRLTRLSADHQVLCVTHLPQIASCASQHFHVDKTQSGNRTIISVTHLQKKDRVEEIARMMAGHSMTVTTRAHASELLERANHPAS
ncbi:MAG: DNA repair protein RecN [Acidobacteriota bacterium]|nr:DNA repair protein RecN [Acidobacteriota bacterium]